MNRSPIDPGSRDGVRSYANRGGRMGDSRRAQLERLFPLHGVAADATPAWDALLPGHQELWVEVGAGAGEAAVAFARARPQVGLVAFEVYLPAVTSMLTAIEREGLTNLKVALADAVPLLPRWFAPGSVAGINVFFPDPWPKKRHHKRRIVNAAFLANTATVLRAGGELHFASDWRDYAEVVGELLVPAQGWEVIAQGDGEAARHGRPVTRFEHKARAAGRAVWDCRARRAPAS